MTPGNHRSPIQGPQVLPPDFRILFEAAPGCYLVLSTDLTIVAATEAYVRLTGTERSRIIGRKIPTVFPESLDNPGAAGVRNLSASLRRVLNSGIPDSMAIQRYDVPRSKSRGGGLDQRFWSVVNSPVLDPEGNVRWIIHCLEDVTDLVQLKLAACERQIATKQLQEANAELARLYERTRELDSLKTSFLANVADEFRTTLPLILRSVEEGSEDGTLQANSLRTLHLHSRRLLKRVNTLLDFARSEGGRVELILEPTNLPRVTREFAERFRPLIESAGLEFIVDCPPLQLEIPLDRSVWEKVVASLVLNAFRFTVEGSVSISIEPRPDQVVVWVRDTGTGVAQNELPGIFDRFHHITKRYTRAIDQPRLALHVVRELIRQHGGDIEVWSETGTGTTFQVNLPAIEDSGVAATGRLTSQTEEGYVLVADDNPFSRADMSRLLSLYFRVNVAENPSEALKALQSDRPDLILIRLRAPENGAVSLIRSLRADPSTAAIPVILLSSGDTGVLTAIESGADDSLAEPISDQEILLRVQTHIQHAQLQRATAAAARELADWRVELLSKVKENEELDSISNAITHTLQASLPHIGGLIEILERDFSVTLDAKRRNYLSYIASAAQEMDSLIDDLLSFSRVSQTGINKTAVNFRGLVQDVLAEFKEPRSGPPTHWVIGELPCVYGDPQMLRLVLTSLISNALKFSSGRPERRIEIGAAESGYGGVVFFVRDNGVGFKMELADKLFGVLQRLHSHEEFEGAGIGLAIVKRLIQKHGGRTWATGITGEGATFYCSLPPKQKENGSDTADTAQR